MFAESLFSLHIVTDVSHFHLHPRGEVEVQIYSIYLPILSLARNSINANIGNFESPTA